MSLEFATTSELLDELKKRSTAAFIVVRPQVKEPTQKWDWLLACKGEMGDVLCLEAYGRIELEEQIRQSWKAPRKRRGQ